MRSRKAENAQLLGFGQIRLDLFLVPPALELFAFRAALRISLIFRRRMLARRFFAARAVLTRFLPAGALRRLNSHGEKSNRCEQCSDDKFSARHINNNPGRCWELLANQGRGSELQRQTRVTGAPRRRLNRAVEEDAGVIFLVG